MNGFLQHNETITAITTRIPVKCPLPVPEFDEVVEAEEVDIELPEEKPDRTMTWLLLYILLSYPLNFLFLKYVIFRLADAGILLEPVMHIRNHEHLTMIIVLSPLSLPLAVCLLLGAAIWKAVAIIVPMVF